MDSGECRKAQAVSGALARVGCWFIGLLGVVGYVLCPGGACAADRPNVLFIAVDDLNDWVGCLGGHPQAMTPNIDRLAERGVLFTNAHCAAPACKPSRSAVFSGLDPERTGVWSNQSRGIRQLAPDIKLLPEVFHEAGYRTLGAGKLIHTGSTSKEIFADYLSVEQRWSPLSKDEVSYRPEELKSKGTWKPRHVAADQHGKEVILPLNGLPSDRAPDKKAGESFDWGGFDVPDSDFGDVRITDWAIGKLGAMGEDPFFLAVGYYRPHIPLWAPERFFDRFREKRAELPMLRADDLKDVGRAGTRWALEAVTAGSHETVAKSGQWRDAVEAYLACVTFVDEQIGRLLDALDRSGKASNTIVVLWSDHGWHLGEKEHWGKWTGWERSTRVPLIVSVPSVEGRPGHASCSSPVSLLDIYPTLMDYCGLAAAHPLGGMSLRPLLENPDARPDRTVLTRFDQGNLSARNGRWRYIRYAEGEEELYDLQKDPNEWENLIDKPRAAGVLARFRMKLAIE